MSAHRHGGGPEGTDGGRESGRSGVREMREQLTASVELFCDAEARQ